MICHELVSTSLRNRQLSHKSIVSATSNHDFEPRLWTNEILHHLPIYLSTSPAPLSCPPKPGTTLPSIPHNAQGALRIPSIIIVLPTPVAVCPTFPLEMLRRPSTPLSLDRNRSDWCSLNSARARSITSEANTSAPSMNISEPSGVRHLITEALGCGSERRDWVRVGEDGGGQLLVDSSSPGSREKLGKSLNVSGGEGGGMTTPWGV